MRPGYKFKARNARPTAGMLDSVIRTGTSASLKLRKLPNGSRRGRPKSEQIQNLNDQNEKRVARLFLSFEFWLLDIVSSFVLRISNLVLAP